MKSIKHLLSLSAMLSTIGLFAQPPVPPATPIDGGLGILLLGGAVYGIKKLRDSRRE